MSRQSIHRQAFGCPTRLATVALCVSVGFASPARAALTEAPRLLAVYDTILDARFERADAALKLTCPPAPSEACAALRTVSVFWQILLDPESQLLDGRFTQLAATAIGASEAWTKREPQRAEAWFYLAGSYAPLVQFRVLRGEWLAAARDGRRILDALEHALRLDPGLDDAYFGIGLYHYYADVAPRAARILRWLLLLPGGDRVKGLREMLQARQKGALLKGEADYQLQQIYLSYEHKPSEALELLRDLDSRYPFNPLFLQRLAEVSDEQMHDHATAAAAWQVLLDRARGGRVYTAARLEVRARIGLAGQLDAMFETDRAIDLLKAALDTNPSALSPGDRARAQLRLALAYDRRGERDLAVKSYTAVRDQAPDNESQIRSRALLGLRQTPDRSASEAYRLSLDGWRAYERGALDQAVAWLARAVDLNPADQVARYRYAYVLVARGDRARAQQLLETLLASNAAPSFVLASAYVEYARLLESAGDRTRAIATYRRAAMVTGGDTHAREDARVALKRLGAS